MTIWLVEPRDPLIVREGRPFGPEPGALATSLPFPFPSTMAGGARTRSALDEDGIFKYGREDKKELDRLKEIRIRGPLLVQLANEDDTIAKHEGEEAWLVPIPQDVQLFESGSKETVILRQLLPLDPPTRAQTDFGQRECEKHLCVVGIEPAKVPPGKRKPYDHKLHYWYWKYFQNWLIDPTQLVKRGAVSLSSLGHEDLIREYRMHVSMDSDKEIGKEGLLFGTSGLEFTSPGAGKERLHDARRLALVIDVEDEAMAPQAGVAGFGGERRLVTWRQSNAHFPPCPPALKQAIKNDRHCRLILLSPACFTQGYSPAWLRTTHAQACGVKVGLRAVAVPRPQVVSGWDLALGAPKPSRRLAPAGTVFFLSVQGSDDALTTWVEQTWMQCISDDKQDRRDGFGLAVLGTWSGQPMVMQERDER